MTKFLIIGSGIAGLTVLDELLNSSLFKEKGYSASDITLVASSDLPINLPPIAVVHPFPGLTIKFDEGRLKAFNFFLNWRKKLSSRNIEFDKFFSEVNAVRPLLYRSDLEAKKSRKVYDSYLKYREFSGQFGIKVKESQDPTFRRVILYNPAFVIDALGLRALLVKSAIAEGVNVLDATVEDILFNSNNYLVTLSRNNGSFFNEQVISAEKVICCTGVFSDKLLELSEFRYNFGELIVGSVQKNEAFKKLSNKLVINRGHSALLSSGSGVIGSTYRHPDDRRRPVVPYRESQRQVVLNFLFERYQKYHGGDGINFLNAEVWSGRRASMRRDKLPVVGEISSTEGGFYVNFGYGSKGFLLAPIMASKLVKRIFNPHSDFGLCRFSKVPF